MIGAPNSQNLNYNVCVMKGMLATLVSVQIVDAFCSYIEDIRLLLRNLLYNAICPPICPFVHLSMRPRVHSVAPTVLDVFFPYWIQMKLKEIIIKEALHMISVNSHMLNCFRYFKKTQKYICPFLLVLIIVWIIRWKYFCVELWIF